MAHFAKLDKDNNVISVHPVDNDVIIIDGSESEQAGIDFLTNLYNHDLWKQTSYNKNFRKNYASPGYKYDAVFDAFIPPRPYPSWKLNYTTFQWDPPVPAPEDGEDYIWKWSELNKEWVKFSVPKID